MIAHFIEAPMNIADAMNAVYRWLTTKQPINFHPKSGRTIDEQHFSVSFQQTFPERRLLQFQIVPEQLQDCWRVIEVAV